MLNIKRKQLKVELLEFEKGDQSFAPTDFIRYVQPYFADLQNVGRDNYLFVATYGDGTKPDVTGYKTDTTINATINTRAVKSEKTNGKWAVYKLKRI
jgi:hypothetical protein